MFLSLVSPLRVRSAIPYEGPFIFPPANELTFEFAAERLILSAIENCAVDVLLAHLPPAVKADLDVSLLPPSLKRRIRLVDERDMLWAAVRAYFRPIMHPVDGELTFTSHGLPVYVMSELTCLARDVHLLLIASRENSQVELDSIQRRENLRALVEQHDNVFGPEARARLTVMLGLFNALTAETSLDTLKARPGSEVWLKDRLDEILDDAYLNEASSIRRFISYESNRASLRRDLRKILKAIVRERNWAKAMFVVGKQLVALPTSAADVLHTVLEQVGLPRCTGPIVTPTRTIPLWLARERSRPLRYWRIPTRSLTDDSHVAPWSHFEHYEYEEV